ncbi:claudin-18-like [Tachysurus ichikawai]
MFCFPGICAIAGVSIFANLIVTNFALTTFTSPNGLGVVGSGLVGSPLTPRYTFGSALFVGWVGGGVLFVGGILLCLACRGLMPEKRYEGTVYKPATQSGIYRSEGYSKNHNSSYKAHSMDGRPTNQGFDYV